MEKPGANDGVFTGLEVMGEVDVLADAVDLDMAAK